MKEDFDAYHKYLNKEPSQGIDPEMQAFLDSTENLRVPKSSRSKGDLWRAIDEATDDDTEASGGKARLVTFAPWIGIAAAIALLIVFLPWSSDREEAAFEIAEITSKASETRPIVLPDSSVVTMNALSKLSYKADGERLVALEGEAFFEVQKGEPFKVDTELGRVEVLGTSFNVYSRADQFHVACKTGKVRVEIPSKDFDEILLPGDQVRLDRDTILFTQVQHEFVGRWQTGEFYFDKRPVREVLEEIGRQYDIAIDYDSLEMRIFTGYFIKEDIELALTMVCEPLDLTYEFADAGRVVIKSK
ncbi:MAG: FecR domain-containing protein [Bacteroidota bacterium]